MNTQAAKIKATVEDLYAVPNDGKAEQQIIDKIRDYFAAGTLVVWDVDVLRKGIVRVYRADDPNQPTHYERGEIAEAEPALPGWTLAVDELFN